jgi:hypothetical protein
MGGVVKAIGNVFESAWDTLEDVAKTAGHIVKNTVKGDFKELWHDFGSDIKGLGGDVGDMLRSQFNVVGEMFAAPFDAVGLDSIGSFSRNVFGGIGNNLALMVEGITEGKWSKFRDGLMGTFTTALYVIAGVIGVVTGQWWLTAMAVVALDGQHNQGMLTKDAVELLGKIETAITQTHYLQKYAAEVTTALVVVSSLVAGAYGGDALIKWANISSLSQLLNYYSYASGVYGIYDSIKAFEEFREYYKNLLDEYMAWAEQAKQAYAQSRAAWFDLFANIENQEICYESMAGGYLYNAGAGSDEYSVSTIHEPNAYMLSIDTKRDTDLDRTIFFNSEVDYTDLKLEYYKEPIMKWM